MCGSLSFFALNSTLFRVPNDLGLNIKHSLKKEFYCVGICMLVWLFWHPSFCQIWECTDAGDAGPRTQTIWELANIHTSTCQILLKHTGLPKSYKVVSFLMWKICTKALQMKMGFCLNYPANCLSSLLWVHKHYLR